MSALPSRRDLVEAGAAAFGIAALGCRATAKERGADDAAQKPSAADAERKRVLAELLEKNRLNHPIYGGGLANHLSMELCALFALGAPVARLRAFSASYSSNLESFPTEGPAVSKSTWREQLGQPAALHGFVQFFQGELREHGREAALRALLGSFAPSMASELFHGLIRTGYGVQFDDDAEIAHGLAYWAIRPLSLGVLEPTKGTEPDFTALLARVRATPALASAKLGANSNSRRMQQASRLEGFAEVVGALKVEDDALDRMARAVLALYSTTRDFTALHALTSTHAVRILLPYFPDRELALRYQAQALIAAYIRMAAPAFDASLPGEAPAWDVIIAKAIQSDDDHDAKLVFSCRDEQSARSDELYRLAAARRVG